ncbi:ABC transporter ATP-binding protein [Clostridium sp. HBUAS56010]|uniref:ABC transporter ATP-binding protein n=1 Tax=Clostridium sp. HBUAS56010 TaxID=2571127 RepID=UPI001178C033|nr:ABC transporter ATP-binding protein [Clostridium sp. HBUAS56010]
MRLENAIEVHNVTKRFKVFLDKGRTLKELLLFSKRRKYEEREVLKKISFEVKKGEAIGLIGHNGCGKSTTLKLLTKIMYPDSGIIEMRGRISSLIELGAGFHPDMSGRQNIYTNASIFGLTRKEIDERLNDIIAFSELEQFIDNPVRTYSSGMYMRLAFSIAINVDADILLIDEILAVGDANFQAKCFNKLREIKANGATIVIVSHSLGQIEQICDRTIWIQDGIVIQAGPPRDVHFAYMDFMGKKRDKTIEVLKNNKKIEEKIEIENGDPEYKNSDPTEDQKQRWGNGYARIKEILSLDKDNIPRNVFCTGEDILIRFNYKVLKTVNNAVVGIGIYRSDGIHCYGTNTFIDNIKGFNLSKDGYCKISLNHIGLLPGEYSIDLAIETDVGTPIDYFKEAYKIQIYSVINDIGVSRIDHTWAFVEECDEKY